MYFPWKRITDGLLNVTAELGGWTTSQLRSYVRRIPIICNSMVSVLERFILVELDCNGVKISNLTGSGIILMSVPLYCGHLPEKATQSVMVLCLH